MRVAIKNREPRPSSSSSSNSNDRLRDESPWRRYVGRYCTAILCRRTADNNQQSQKDNNKRGLPRTSGADSHHRDTFSRSKSISIESQVTLFRLAAWVCNPRNKATSPKRVYGRHCC